MMNYLSGQFKWLTFACLVSIPFSPVLPLALSRFCPLTICECESTGTVANCSDKQLDNVDIVIFSNILANEMAGDYFRSVKTLNLENNNLARLPEPEDILMFMPGLSEILLDGNDAVDCEQLDSYRREGIIVRNDRCPAPTNNANEFSPEMMNITPYAPTQLNQQIPKPIVQTVPPNTATVTIPESAKSFPVKQTKPTGNEAESVAWTVIFLNCCFVGISGMIIGSVLTMLLPVLYRLLVRWTKKYANKNGEYVKISNVEAPLFYPPQSPTPFYKPAPGTGKRIVPLEV